jgi:hypothetical protein
MHGAAVVLAVLAGVAGSEHPFVGTWVANISKSKPHPDYPLKAVTLQIAVVGDTVTIDDTHVHGSGKETHGTHSFQADGKEHPFEAPALGSGVVVVARWLSSHVLDTVVKKDGKEITRVVYEVSPDGKTMTATRSGMFAQMALFERR